MIVAGTKIVPLYVTENRLKELEKLCQKKGKVVSVTPFKQKKVGVVITGNEVFKGRIKDKFGEYIQKKVEALGSVIQHQTVVPDDEDLIAKAVLEMKGKGCDVIITCAGLSIDPDDVTLEGVQKSGAKIVSYGAPVMPGAMFMFAKLGDIPIMGAPAAVIFNDATVLDIMLPRVLADIPVTKEDIVDLGYGGLCLNCGVCAYPVCPFGK